MTLESSYDYCMRVCRSRARNFYFGFLFLPKVKRSAISAVYAFMRHCDDIADSSEPLTIRKSALAVWRSRVMNLFQDGPADHPMFPALAETIRRFNIPVTYLSDLMDGVAMDLDVRRFNTFDDLYPYCYKVASVAGLASLHIFGFTDRKALEYGESCGIAFQLTNILRDLAEDAACGRVYLPLEDLARFGCSEQDLAGGTFNSNFTALAAFEAERARRYYDESAPLIRLVHPDSRRALRVLIGIYRGILNKIIRSGFCILDRRIRLSLWEKALIMLNPERSS